MDVVGGRRQSTRGVDETNEERIRNRRAGSSRESRREGSTRDQSLLPANHLAQLGGRFRASFTPRDRHGVGSVSRNLAQAVADRETRDARRSGKDELADDEAARDADLQIESPIWALFAKDHSTVLRRYLAKNIHHHDILQLSRSRVRLAAVAPTLSIQ